jgi:hypothetical protein
MEKLRNLIAGCKASVSVSVNGHRDCYESVEDHLRDMNQTRKLEEIASKDVIAEMIRLDTVVCIQFYPHTPIGFFVVWHWDLEAAIEKALEILGTLKD